MSLPGRAFDARTRSDSVEREEHESDDRVIAGDSAARLALTIVLLARCWRRRRGRRRSSPSRGAPAAQAASARRGGEANLVLPDLSQVDVGGYDGRIAADDRPGRLARSASCSAWSSSTS